jgi:sugar lactone lactonase YvrE
VCDEVKPPKKSLRQELDNATVTADRRIDIAHGPPNGFVVKNDAKGNITNYVQYDENGRGVKRVDLTGRPHGSVPTPHVVEMVHDVAPDGTVYVRELTKQVRPATPDEIP